MWCLQVFNHTKPRYRTLQKPTISSVTQLVSNVISLPTRSWIQISCCISTASGSSRLFRMWTVNYVIYPLYRPILLPVRPQLRGFTLCVTFGACATLILHVTQNNIHFATPATETKITHILSIKHPNQSVNMYTLYGMHTKSTYCGVPTHSLLNDWQNPHSVATCIGRVIIRAQILIMHGLRGVGIQWWKAG